MKRPSCKVHMALNVIMNESKLKRKSSVGKCLLYANYYYSKGFGKIILQRNLERNLLDHRNSQWLSACHPE